MDLEEKELKANYVYQGKILNLRVDDVVLSSGETAKREYVEHIGGAGVLAVDEDGFIYLVRQYRYAYRAETLEIPAGKLEKGEKPIVTATRELLEETGLEGVIEDFGLLYPTPGYTSEPLYIFLATSLKKKEMHLDDGEYLSLERISFIDALKKVLDGEIKDAKTCYAILKYAYINKIYL